MENHLSIRNARDSERKIILDLTIAAYAQYQAVLPPGFWTFYQHNLVATVDGEGNGERLVAEQNGSIVGSVMLFPPATNAYASARVSTSSYPEVRFLAVLPQTRGQGVGTALMKECERRAQEAGAQAIGLHTAKVMEAAVRMYERLGYVRTPETDFQANEGVTVLGYRRVF